MELYGASFFQISNDTRFLLLVMAIEALLVRPDRPESTWQHIDNLVRETRSCEALKDNEKEPLIEGLKNLCKASIRQTGKQLAEEQLKGHQYRGKDAPKFFLDCYDLRSKMVHGSLKFPSPEEIKDAINGLILFVSDLLAGDLGDTA